MQSRNKFFEDTARLFGGLVSLASEGKRECDDFIRHRVQKLASADSVSREEFDAVHSMASKALRENEDLRKQIQELQPSRPSKPSRPSRAKPSV